MVQGTSRPGNATPLRQSALHSRYNPVGEAEKYITSLSFRENPRFFILIEPGRGYIIPILHRKFPEAKIIVLHVRIQEETELYDIADPASVSKPMPVVWSPESGIALQRFLEREIPDIEAAAIRIIEWRPALAVYGEGYLRLFSETVEFVKRIDANTRTIRAFGARWFKNFFKIMGMTRRVIHHAGSLVSLPCIITGAGPSLEESLPLIKKLKNKERLFILGVSASVPALHAGGLIPDLIITTDGGGWALFHLYECLREGDTKPPLGLAASLYAALPSQAGDLPLLLIGDGSLWQNLILQGLKLPFINLVQRGTVTASALDLAFVLTRGNVFIAGMDLSHRDICTHARPYSFNRALEERSSRLNPVYTQTFTRSFGIIAGGSHNIYASWFGRQLGTYPKRLYTLGNNHPVFKNLKPWGAADRSFDRPSKRKSAARTLGFQTIPPGTNLAKQGTEILIQALAVPQTSERIKRELTLLLFPDEKDVAAETLCDKILDITAAYTGGREHG